MKLYDIIRQLGFGKTLIMPGTPSVIKYKKLTPRAKSPYRSSSKAAGCDLKSAYAVTIPARGTALCSTDLQIVVPEGTYGRIAPRSGLALKGIDVGAGVLDEDYRGCVNIVLYNHSDTSFMIEEGDRIAQLICEKICYPELKEVEELDITQRGSGGFGSTGMQ